MTVLKLVGQLVLVLGLIAVMQYGTACASVGQACHKVCDKIEQTGQE